jgi:hypothetical protein
VGKGNTGPAPPKRARRPLQYECQALAYHALSQSLCTLVRTLEDVADLFARKHGRIHHLKLVSTDASEGALLIGADLVGEGAGLDLERDNLGTHQLQRLPRCQDADALIRNAKTVALAQYPKVRRQVGPP